MYEKVTRLVTGAAFLGLAALCYSADAWVQFWLFLIAGLFTLSVTVFSMRD
jgi:hypothetical protein